MTDALVLVTGASGFIGSHFAEQALQKGYRVRVVVRRAEQTEKLEKLLGGPSERIEFVVVPEFTNEDAFVEAVKGVDYVVHLASPMHGHGGSMKEYVEPTVQGTLSMLNAAKAESSVRKVLLMSSIMGMLPFGIFSGEVEPPALTRENQNIFQEPPADLDESTLQGMPGNVKKYQAAKMATRKKTHEWIETEKPHFAVYTFYPSMTIGPSLLQASASEMDAQNGVMWSVLTSGVFRLLAFYVDVRNVAEAFVKAMEVDAPTGMEVILRGHKTSWKEIATIVKEAYPEEESFAKLEVPEKEPYIWQVETKAADEILKVQWTPTEKLIRDVLDQQLSFRK